MSAGWRIGVVTLGWVFLFGGRARAGMPRGDRGSLRGREGAEGVGFRFDRWGSRRTLSDPQSPRKLSDEHESHEKAGHSADGGEDKQPPGAGVSGPCLSAEIDGREDEVTPRHDRQRHTRGDSE